MLPLNKVTEVPQSGSPATQPAATGLPALPGQTETATIPTATEGAPEVAPSGKLPAPSFEAETYMNEMGGFAFEYPRGWTVNEMVVGDRGTQVQFVSEPAVAEMPVVPTDATRLNATIYQWDPKGDLAAYLANWKSSWEASGFTVLEEEQITLDMGLPAVRLTVQTPDATVIYLVTAIGDHYLVLTGEGNLELVKEIVGRVRPIFQ
jgi:hypothetical protein